MTYAMLVFHGFQRYFWTTVWETDGRSARRPHPYCGGAMSAITLFCDFETRSPLSLKERGLDNYLTQAEVLMLSYAVNDQEPQIWLPHEGPLPEHIELLIRRPEIKKVAFNASFERSVFERLLNLSTPIGAWDDPMISARYSSIAGDLHFVGKVLGLAPDKLKDTEGKKLIKLFCEHNKHGEYNDWRSHPAEFEKFIDYCKQDTNSEREIFHKLKAFSLPTFERRAYVLDQEINERGIPTDPIFIANASRIVSEERNTLLTDFKQLTGLENPNSTKQLLEWLKAHGYPYGSLGAKWVAKALLDVAAEDEQLKALKLRQQLAKSSTAKLEALQNFVSPDGNLRRQYVFMGAARTGRWSGRAVQLQNLPRPTIKDTEGGVAAILFGDREAVRKIGPPLEVVASCLRSAFRASPGKKFVVCDLSSIETRVSAWLSDCYVLSKVFEDGRDPYIEFATKLFGVTYNDVTKDQRQQSKPAVLGACYGLGGGREEIDKNGDEIRTGLWGYGGSLGVEMTQEFSQECVNIYRRSYPEVPAAWRKLEAAFTAALRTGGTQITCRLRFDCVKPGRLIYITLPSSRRLSYIRPRLDLTESWDGSERTKLSYENNVLGGWGRVSTWGGKIFENAVQSIARDVLAVGLIRAAETGFHVCGHSHDEIICEEDINGSLGLEQLRDCMIQPIEWAPGLILDADGWEGGRYKK
jgi:DNA polymerase bacteriophage-type